MHTLFAAVGAKYPTVLELPQRGVVALLFAPTRDVILLYLRAEGRGDTSMYTSTCISTIGLEHHSSDAFPATTVSSQNERISVVNQQVPQAQKSVPRHPHIFSPPDPFRFVLVYHAIPLQASLKVSTFVLTGDTGGGKYFMSTCLMLMLFLFSPQD